MTELQSASAQNGAVSNVKDVDFNENFPFGIIVRPRSSEPNVRKSCVSCFLEFISVCAWVFGFLFLGFTCLFIFYFLVYYLLKYAILITVFRHNLPKGMGTTTDLYCHAALFTIFLCYTSYWLLDYGAENRGAHPIRFMRSLLLWQYIAAYFPMQLILSEELVRYSHLHGEQHGERNTGEQKQKTAHKNNVANPLLKHFRGLPATRNYLVGFHPHGIFCTGAFVNFLTDATGFSLAFPDLRPRLGVLKAHFKSPFYRDYLLSLGITAATREGIRYVLDQNQCKTTGNFLVIVVGGAPESLEAQPHEYSLLMRQRFGFFKLALQTGSSLIPCLSFGEQAMYNQVSNKPGSFLRRLQDWLLEVTAFGLPVIYARGPLPYRTPVNTVVGAPIECERIEEPTDSQVLEIKQKYAESLRNLFNRYKEFYDPKAGDLVFI
ncbi:unnamed protein product [Calicophoron daubneyi]|uniref:Acyltransferase n=1 Tax=Calicophoron daubneyi TaxID=300641 RepID=A0AAV2T3B4_CALDB